MGVIAAATLPTFSLRSKHLRVGIARYCYVVRIVVHRYEASGSMMNNYYHRVFRCVGAPDMHLVLT